MGDAEACGAAGYAALGTDFVAASLAQNGSSKKKENVYAKRVDNGNHAENAIYGIFGFPKYRKRGRNQPDVLFTDSENKRFIGEIKSFEDGRVAVTVDQFRRYEKMAPAEDGKKCNLFYFFATHNGSAGDINDVYAVDYASMKRLFDEKKHYSSRWRLKERWSKKIDCAERANQKLLGYSGRTINNDGRKGKEIMVKNKKEIIKKHNRKGEHIRLFEFELSGCCPNSKRIWKGCGVQNIVIHYREETDFIINAAYPAAAEAANGKKKPVQTTFFGES